MTRIVRRSAFGVLTGLSVAVTGVCAANAATTTPVTDTFSIATSTETSVLLSFPQFNPLLGTLTSVDFSLNSSLDVNGETVAGIFYPPSDSVLSEQAFFSSGNFNSTFSGIGNFPMVPLADYTGSGDVIIDASLDALSNSPATWTANGPGQGLTLVYDYTPAVAATPLPATLPLFATGLGALGLLGWRRKRRAQAVT